MHVSSIIECTDVGYLEVDPLASFTRSDFLRARLGLSLMGLRIENVSIPPDDTYHKYHNWNDLCNLDKLLETIQEDIQSFKLPTVEAASLPRVLSGRQLTSLAIKSEFLVVNMVII